MNQSFDPSVCTREGYVDAVREIRDLTVAKNQTPHLVHPLYLLLIRPPAAYMLEGVAARVTAGSVWEVYAIAAEQE